MSNDGKPTSWTAMLFRTCAYLFGTVILLHLTLSLLAELWWLLLIIGIVTLAWIGLRLWIRFRDRWLD
ncbi:hypothetical protein [Leucobacter sp. 1207-22]|uniref:hypothetical protein n=1 Tax=Leucobacter sp. 1207-22 TaxID=2604456 RepID=UPI0040634B5C